MDVHALPVELPYPEGPALGPQVAHGRPGGLLHHVAEVSGEDQLPLSPHRHGLDEQDVAARLVIRC